MQKKTVAVITGTRAEYGLLRPVIQKLLKSETLTPAVIVTGAHLAPEYGSTVTEIEKDGVPIAARIPILKFGQGRQATADTVAYTIQQFTRWFLEYRPAAALVLGDRYEIFAAAQAAAYAGVPVAHISGGDVTLGAADDWYRHCITKIAHLHFPSCEEYARRVIRMGEAPSTVFNVGGLGDENLRSMPRMDAAQLSESLGFDLTRPFGLVTFHPETAGDADPKQQMDALLGAMDEISKQTGLRWLITKSNADAGGLDINRMIDDWTARRQEFAAAYTSLGVKRYLSAMSLAALVAGNSSSGVVETPSVGVPTLNIGDRQKGRIICSNVICCPAEQDRIYQAMRRALDPDFVQTARRTVSPYNGGDTSRRIVEVLERFLQDPTFGTPKTFYDGD